MHKLALAIYNAAQVISEYLKPLYRNNDFIITNTQNFPSLIQNQPPLSADEEYVSYDVESLFTNVPVNETITYILGRNLQKREVTRDLRSSDYETPSRKADNAEHFHTSIQISRLMAVRWGWGVHYQSFLPTFF